MSGTFMSRTLANVARFVGNLRSNKKKGTTMKLAELTAIAKSKNINPSKHSKAELIKAIQTAEGNIVCFATAYDGVCDQAGCSWREDCFAAARAGKLA
jgi:hypothetical protein